jgi:uncharacterized protein (TIGR02117 family)
VLRNLARRGSAIPAAAGILLAVALIAPAGAEGRHEVVVVSNGWHSAIVIRRDDLPPAAVPEIADFPDAVAFEFGWGDAEYYPATRRNLAMTLAAALPGPAVVHLVSHHQFPPAYGPPVESFALTLSADGLDRMIVYLHDSFRREAGRRAQPSAPGIFPFSSFYPGTGEFHLFNTCNTWTARALARAGVPVKVDGVQTARDLTDQLRRLTAAAR